MWEKSENWRSKIGEQKSKTVQERFWEKVDKSGDCWEWLGCKDKDGYGFFRVNGKNKKAHRFALEIGGDELGDSLVLHKCDNPSCVRPLHLFTGDISDNQIDAAIKKRTAGQKLTVEDVRQIRERRKAGETAKKIASDYSIKTGTVYHIQYRRKWKHVD